MKKKTQLRLCGYLLLALLLMAAASSIQLEATGGNPVWVWLHVVVCSIFISVIIWHVCLHLRWKVMTDKPGWLRWILSVGLLMSISAIAATAHWLAMPHHSVIGAIHGKIGFIFLILALVHAIRHRRFYMKRD